MNERKKGLVVLGVLGLLLIIIVAVVIITALESNKRLEELKTIINSNESKIIYLSKPTCYYCNLIEPITNSLEEEFGLDYVKINTGELSNSELLKTLNVLGVNVDTFGTPYIAIVKDGKIIDQQIGYTDEDVLFKLFKKHQFIAEDATLNMNYIDDLDLIWNHDSAKVLLIGESGDTVSIESRIILRKLSKKYNIDINYYDATRLVEDTKYEELLDTLGVEQLPVLVIVQNENILAKTTVASEKEYEQFFKENNYIK